MRIWRLGVRKARRRGKLGCWLLGALGRLVLRVVVVHRLVVLGVTVVLLGIRKSRFWLLDVHKCWVIGVLIGAVVCEKTIPNLLVEVLIVSHSTSSKLGGNLRFGGIKDAEELVTASLSEPDLDSCRGRNEAVQRHHRQLEVVRPEDGLLEVQVAHQGQRDVERLEILARTETFAHKHQTGRCQEDLVTSSYLSFGR